MSMEFEFSVTAHGCGFILLTPRGAASAEQIEQMYQAAFDIADSTSNYRLLVDMMATELAYPMDHFLPLMQRVSPYLSRFRTARLIGQESFRHHLVETVSQKSAFSLKNFEDRQAAIDWLLVE